ncbi:hypothetical protein [Bacillus sp. PS06]|uniref:hypothetical protein n=1 Tax=Bacillus sp. PS06 TaxID=2764176 RepID=UPI0017809325|nr:hypothetical protein [Bacillus sp. PS06]MBD8068416.1 hypothetical protein [Bacillus sp. PS06]
MRSIYVIPMTLFMLVGCTNDKPVPEASSLSIESVESNDIQGISPVSAMKKSGRKQVVVQQQVIGHNVYVECIIPDYTFGEEGRLKGEGYIELSVDGKVVDQISTAAFIIKGLHIGEHIIKLEIKKADGQKYQLQEEFSVTIE